MLSTVASSADVAPPAGWGAEERRRSSTSTARPRRSTGPPMVGSAPSPAIGLIPHRASRPSAARRASGGAPGAVASRPSVTSRRAASRTASNRSARSVPESALLDSSATSVTSAGTPSSAAASARITWCPGGSCGPNASTPLTSRTTTRRLPAPSPTVSHGRSPTLANVTGAIGCPAPSTAVHVHAGPSGSPDRSSRYTATAASARAVGLGWGPVGTSASARATATTVLTTRPVRGVCTTSNPGGGPFPDAEVVAAATVALRPFTIPKTDSATWRSANASTASASWASAESCADVTPNCPRSCGPAASAFRTATPSHTRRVLSSARLELRIDGKRTRSLSTTAGRPTTSSISRPRVSAGWLPSRVSSARRSAPRTASEVRSIRHRSASGSRCARSRSRAATEACSIDGARTYR